MDQKDKWKIGLNKTTDSSELLKKLTSQFQDATVVLLIMLPLSKDFLVQEIYMLLQTEL